MTVDGPPVLVSGTDRDRVGEFASSLAGYAPVRTSVATEADIVSAGDVEVVVYVDGESSECFELLPEDAARIVVFEDPDDFDSGRPAAYDRVMVEPLLPGDLESTVTLLARRVRYDRRLQECAELATRCGQVESTGEGAATGESRKLRQRVDDATAELDGLVSEFSSDDFRQAFRTLAAD